MSGIIQYAECPMFPVVSRPRYVNSERIMEVRERKGYVRGESCTANKSLRRTSVELGSRDPKEQREVVVRADKPSKVIRSQVEPDSYELLDAALDWARCEMPLRVFSLVWSSSGVGEPAVERSMIVAAGWRVFVADCMTAVGSSSLWLTLLTSGWL